MSLLGSEEMTGSSLQKALEKDPNGIGQHEVGSKLDSGKDRCGLVLGDFSRALRMVSKIGTYGAKKYTDHGWLEVQDGVERYTDAMLRHWFDENTSCFNDDDTGLPHAAHLAWNALARLELMIREDGLHED